ncbi:MAG: hypothetical protein M1825_004935 [Sarcosagium campestre]|nr:MAG: hypothetical protein M1825_004935 [Sarcosagium campestre]
MATSSRVETKWADGLRGFASLLVVTAHITRSLAPHLISPSMGEGKPPVLMQLPIFRLFIMGRASVACFALLSGFVNGLKPLKLSRAGSYDSALAAVAKSAFRRTGRFMVPAITATCISWFFCQLGAYRVAKHTDSAWIDGTSPSQSASWPDAFASLIHNLISTWVHASNKYDQIQWTLMFLLKGSFLVYITLVSTIYVKPKHRLLCFLAMYLYMYKCRDAIIGINVYWGLLLVEICLDPDIQRFAVENPNARTAFSVAMIATGMWFCSYPEEHPEWRPWSKNLQHLGDALFPAGAEYSRFYPSLGVEALSIGIVFNTTAKKIFSHPWLCWLGQMSFPIYLLHAPLIRTVLTWMLYGISIPVGGGPKGDNPPPEKLHLHNRYICAIAIPLFYVFLYRVAFYWNKHVDAWCGRVTNKLEDLLFTDQAKQSEKVLPSTANGAPS